MSKSVIYTARVLATNSKLDCIHHVKHHSSTSINLVNIPLLSSKYVVVRHLNSPVHLEGDIGLFFLAKHFTALRIKAGETNKSTKFPFLVRNHFL